MMTAQIDKFNKELQLKFHKTIDELIGSFVLSGLTNRLLDEWDNILQYLDTLDEELNEKFAEGNEENVSSEDFVKAAAISLLYAIMYRLDESNQDDDQ